MEPTTFSSVQYTEELPPSSSPRAFFCEIPDKTCDMKIEELGEFREDEDVPSPSPSSSSLSSSTKNFTSRVKENNPHKSGGQQKQSFRVHPPLYNHPHPWLLITHGKHYQRQTFYNIIEGRYYTRIINELHNKIVAIGSGCNGWLLLQDMSTYDCFLQNIVSNEKVDLPPLLEKGVSVINGNCILSSTPRDPNCRVMFFDRNKSTIMTCKPGDKSFDRTKPVDDSEILSSVTILQGKLYGLLMPERELAIADTNNSYRFTNMNLKVNEKLSNVAAPSYLVESCGDILLVQRLASCVFMKEIFCFKVYIADFCRMEWVRLKSLGERAIFLNTFQGFSCSTDKLRGNTIYFTYGGGDRNIYMFNMEDKNVSMYLPCPIVSLGKSILTWIMMPSVNNTL